MSKVLIDRDILKELLESYEIELDVNECNGFQIFDSERELVDKVKDVLNK